MKWQPINTMPRNRTKFLLWYARERQTYVVYFDELYDYNNDSKEWVLIDSYIVVDSPANHTDRFIIDKNKLEGSYWQPLPELPV